MYELIGISRGNRYSDYKEEVVATFDSREKALEYIKKAKLKQPKWHRTFKCGTLLSCYDYTEVQGKEEIIDPPHNPEI